MKSFISKRISRKLFDVAVIGNIGIDTNIYLNDWELDFKVESSFTENIDCIGQAGGYASRGFARLGKRTAFVGYIGDDFSGRFIKDQLLKESIDVSAVFIDPAGTNRSINLIYKDGTRKNFYDGKSHMKLVPDLEKCSPILYNATIVHFNIPNWARELLHLAKDAGAIISCDLQDLIVANDNYREDFIRNSDIVFFSSVNYPDPAPVIKSLLRMNSNLIIVAGMGAAGCALRTDSEEIRYFEAVELEMPVVDANGAGDALAVGFLSSLIIDGYDILESVFRGQIAARHCCTQKASSSRLITLEALNSYYRALLDKTGNVKKL